MKITKIEEQKNSKEKCNIYIDDKYVFSLSINTIINKKLKEGLDLSQNDIEELQNVDENEKAYIYILDYLSYGDRTTSELKKQLKKKGYSQEAISFAINKALKSKLIDDERYCDRYVYSKLNSSKPDGPQKITSQLLQKGIPLDLIKEKISIYLVHENEQEKIELLARKKLPSIKYKTKYELKGKLFRFIAQKGFNIDDVNSVLDRVLDDIDEEDEDYYD